MSHWKALDRTAALALATALWLTFVPGADVRAAAGSDTPAPSPAAAEMLKSMLEKGLISQEEFDDLYMRQARYEFEAREQAKLPGWLRNWTVGGDLRFRFDQIDYKGEFGFGEHLNPGHDNVDTFNDIARGNRSVGLMRLRIGAEKLVTEWATVGFRLSTTMDRTLGEDGWELAGESFETNLDGNPRSGNVPFGDYFSPKTIAVDRAYLRIHPEFAPGVDLTIGKLPNPFVSHEWASDYVIWDHDISPEGASLVQRFEFIPGALWTRNVAAFFMIDEVASVTIDPINDVDPQTLLPVPDDKDPYMYGFQTALAGVPVEGVELGGRFTFYGYENLDYRAVHALQTFNNGGDAIEDNPFLQGLPGTPAQSNGSLQQIVADGYMTFTPFGERYAITPFGQYSQILTAGPEDVAWSAGVDLGSSDLLKVSFMWAEVARNGTVSIFTDSDFFDGYTNVKGFVLAAERRITDAISLRGRWFHSKIKRKDCKLASTSDPLDERLRCDLGTVEPRIGLFRKTSIDRDRFQVDLLVDF